MKGGISVTVLSSPAVVINVLYKLHTELNFGSFVRLYPFTSEATVVPSEYKYESVTLGA